MCLGVSCGFVLEFRPAQLQPCQFDYCMSVHDGDMVMSETQPKLCRDCKHLAKSSVGDAHSWKCMAERNITSREVDLVTGETVLKRRWLTCYDARTDHAGGAIWSCGTAGLWFEPAPPKFTSVSEPSRIVPTGMIAADLLSQLDSMK